MNYRFATSMVGTLLIMALGSGPVMATVPSVPCPNPIIISMTRTGATAAAPDIADFPNLPLTGMTYNQTAKNTPFRDTFRFKKPKSDCCQFQPGKLIVKYRALEKGVSGSPTSVNDSAGLVYAGSSVAGSSGFIYSSNGQGPVYSGTTRTVVYIVPANIVASGRVSFSVQDDSAVMSATLEVSGCCLTPTPTR